VAHCRHAARRRDDSLEATQDTDGGMNVSLVVRALRTCAHGMPPQLVVTP